MKTCQASLNLYVGCCEAEEGETEGFDKDTRNLLAQRENIGQCCTPSHHCFMQRINRNSGYLFCKNIDFTVQALDEHVGVR